MSRYKFIASDYLLPEVDLSGFIKLKVKDIRKMTPIPRGPVPLDKLDDDMEVLFAASETDIGGLQIAKCTNTPYGLENFIKKRYIYWLNGNFNFKCTTQLKEYLLKSISRDTPVELWSIWFGDETQNITYKKIHTSEIKGFDFDLLNHADCCISIWEKL